MNPRIEIDEIYKEMMAQKEQNVLCDDLLNRIDWIKKIKPDIRQAEITKLSVILIKELQRFSNWEEIKSDGKKATVRISDEQGDILKLFEIA